MHNVNYHSNIVNLFRKGGNFFRNGGNLFRISVLRNSTFCGQGVDAAFSRSSVGKLRQGIREVKESAILTNSTF